MSQHESNAAIGNHGGGALGDFSSAAGLDAGGNRGGSPPSSTRFALWPRYPVRDHRLFEPESRSIAIVQAGDARSPGTRASSSSAPRTRRGVRMFVSLDSGMILSRKEIPTARPMIQLEQFLAIEGFVREHPEFIAGVQRAASPTWRRFASIRGRRAISRFPARRAGISATCSPGFACSRTRTSTPTRSRDSTQ